MPNFNFNQEDIQEALQQERRKLPIHTVRKRLLQELGKHMSVIIIGETGSGKTTQIPQYILESGLHRKAVIAITQPRRVAAVTVAKRVALERACEIGQLVGYCVRFEDVTSASTMIKYMTDGMLLRESILDPLLSRYSTVILDEAHERTVHTDVMFGIVKLAQITRAKQNFPTLRIIIMSATMDVDSFSTYFNNAPVLYVEGRQHPIEVMFTLLEQSDYLFASIVTVFQIHRSQPADEGILVFLTGQDEIESANRTINDIAKDVTDAPPLDVCSLYAALPTNQQLKVFKPSPKGMRKVILSTNVAETSLTIPGIKYVIDCGRVKAKVYNPESNLDLLKVVWTSKAQCMQRSGRAGREMPGVCYRLFTESEYERLTENTIPEILRCNLSSVLLQLLALGVRNVQDFDFMDKPTSQAMADAVDQLFLLGALESKDNLKLTQEGKNMAIFPLDPRLSKVILAAKDYHCLEDALTVVSMLAEESVLYTPVNKKEEAVLVRSKFTSNEGDHIFLLNIFRSSNGISFNKRWCRENFINEKHLKHAADIRRQLRELCCQLSLPFESCGSDTAALRKCFIRGFFMNSAEIVKDGVYMTLSSRKSVFIHPSSCLFMNKPSYVIYNELVHTNKTYMRDVSVVDPEWLYESAPAFFRSKVKLV